MIQAIFEYSANVNLPLASSRMSSQLASPHLYHQLTSRIMEPVLGVLRTTAIKDELADAMRLMESKFFTWSFFSGWLHDECDRLGLWDKILNEGAVEYLDEDRHQEWTWWTIKPHPSLLPPKKLLRGPFTQEKTRFLRCIVLSGGGPGFSDPIYTDLAREGLEQAVGEGVDVSAALPAFWRFGLQPDTELLRKAVLEAGCNKGVVRGLLNRVTDQYSEPSQIDFLDPALWSWADRARVKGDEKGEWLMELLKRTATEIDERKIVKFYPSPDRALGNRACR